MKLSVNKNNMIVLDKGKLELLIDERYMDGTMGRLSGKSLFTLGLLPYRYYKNINDKNPVEMGRYSTLDIPTIVEFFPTDVESGISMKVYPDSIDKKYTIMTFEAGTEMWSRYNVESLENSQMFVNAVLGGKLDNNIPYTMLVSSWLKNLKMNGQSSGIPIAVTEAIIRAMCRDRKTGKPFGVVLGQNPNHSLIGYEFLNVRDASAASIFGALSFEDQNTMLDLSINMTLHDTEQRVSPLEKILKY